jgi:diadenosine tetraphosphate (Ap4A) HIT family hydrolase
VAVERVLRERGDSACLMCALAEGALGPRADLYVDEHTIAFLSRYPLRIGHALIAPRAHVTSFEMLDPEVFADMARQAHRVARALERELAPKRVYVASLGTTRDVPMSSPHLHLHVIPVDGDDERPSSVLTWEHGVYDISEVALSELAARLRASPVRP